MNLIRKALRDFYNNSTMFAEQVYPGADMYSSGVTLFSYFFFFVFLFRGVLALHFFELFHFLILSIFLYYKLID